MSCLELDDDDILKVANPMMDDIIRGLARRDYNLHSCHFSVHLKSHGGPEAFLEMCDQHEAAWGSPGQRSLVAIFRIENRRASHWSGTSNTLLLMAR